MSARQDVVMAPVSRPLAKLLHQVQAQIIKDAEERTAAAGAGELVLLAPGEGRSASVAFHSGLVGLHAYWSASDIHFWRRHVPDSLAYSESRADWHPAHWSGTEYRRDENGRSWSSPVGTHVMDDFGFLVPVDGAR